MWHFSLGIGSCYVAPAGLEPVIALHLPSAGTAGSTWFCGFVPLCLFVQCVGRVQGGVWGGFFGKKSEVMTGGPGLSAGQRAAHTVHQKAGRSGRQLTSCLDQHLPQREIP